MLLQAKDLTFLDRYAILKIAILIVLLVHKWTNFLELWVNAPKYNLQKTIDVKRSDQNFIQKVAYIVQVGARVKIVVLIDLNGASSCQIPAPEAFILWGEPGVCQHV